MVQPIFLNTPQQREAVPGLTEGLNNLVAGILKQRQNQQLSGTTDILSKIIGAQPQQAQPATAFTNIPTPAITQPPQGSLPFGPQPEGVGQVTQTTTPAQPAVDKFAFRDAQRKLAFNAILKAPADKQEALFKIVDRQIPKLEPANVKVTYADGRTDTLPENHPDIKSGLAVRGGLSSKQRIAEARAKRETPEEAAKKSRAIAEARKTIDTEIAEKGATKVVNEIRNDIGEKSFTALGKQQATQLIEQRKDAQDSVVALRTIKEGKKLLDSGIITGKGAQFIVNFGNIAKERLGWDVFADEVKNTEAFIANQGNLVAKIIKQFGAGTGLSDADREFANNIAGGNIAVTEDSLRRIFDISQRAFTNVIKDYQSTAGEVMSKPAAKDLLFDLRLDVDKSLLSANESGGSPSSGFKILSVR